MRKNIIIESVRESLWNGQYLYIPVSYALEPLVKIAKRNDVDVEVKGCSKLRANEALKIRLKGKKRAITETLLVFISECGKNYSWRTPEFLENI